MILLDSTSIIELFLRTYENDYIASNPMLHVHIQEDLILLENQLPFFILEELHEIFINGQSENSSFFDVACKYFSSYIKKIEKKEVKHFTDLIRYSYCPIKHNSFGGGISDLCTAKKLSEAGVIFKLDKKGDALDIEFLKSPATEICPCFTCSLLLNCLPCLKRSFLKIPRFEINDGTESLLRNIMALEQCHYPREAYVCNFMVLLDYLIDTREDVDLLIEKKNYS